MKVGIISHDAGGAEILSSYVKKKNYNFFYSLKGPSIKIFRRKVEKFKNLNLINCINKCDYIITGTSQKSSHEVNAIKICKLKKIKVVSFLDHWINYKKRFFRNNKYIFPEEIWVGDKYAHKLASNIFKKDIKIKFFTNPYFSEIKKYKFQKNKKYLLYISSAYNKNNLTEKKIFKVFLNKAAKLGLKSKKIIFKLHPNEKQMSQYKFFSKKFKIKIVNKLPIENYISSAEAVFGCNSMGLVVSTLMKKKSYNCIFFSKLKSTLPFTKIINLYAKK